MKSYLYLFISAVVLSGCSSDKSEDKQEEDKCIKNTPQESQSSSDLLFVSDFNNILNSEIRTIKKSEKSFLLSKNPLGKVDTNITFKRFDEVISHSPTTPYSWSHDALDSQRYELDGYVDKGQLDGYGVDIYIIDSGLDTNDNPEFQNINIEEPLNLSGCDTDYSGHGTAVASLIAGENLGYAVNSTIIPITFFDSNGSGKLSNLLKAYQYIADKVKERGNPAIVNFSGGSFQTNDILNKATQEITKLGVIFVAAAGNDGSTACNYPAGNPNVLSVSGLGHNGYDIYASNDFNYGSCVDVYAPGKDVVVSRQSGYGISNGTSFASPLVTGILASALSANVISPENFREVINNNSYRFINELEPNKNYAITGKPENWY
ncbi:S8 family serine peptidase [Photobacterium leiognathi]|uniref:S8 family serine peptidase n=1 Tax=Photobacterium leiognathi TaxID=553611 RepID=UPI0029821600|nr:S8 family serine peptidase [Photobacterium leiognathi]